MAAFMPSANVSTSTNIAEGRYRNDPYHPTCSRKICDMWHDAELNGRVEYMPFPTSQDKLAAGLPSTLDDSRYVSAVVGQLTHEITYDQVVFIMNLLGTRIAAIDAVTKKNSSGEILPCGLFRVWVPVEDMAPLEEVAKGRMLVDTQGVWVARTPEEHLELSRYVEVLKATKVKGGKRPVGTVSFEQSKSGQRRESKKQN